MERITICIPAYNSAKVITRCLTSIVDQRCSDNFSIRVVVSDDNSSDRTRSVVSDNFKGVELVTSNVNRGLTENWSHAISYAQGGIVVLLHHDDWLLPGALDFVRDFFRANPNVALAAVSANVESAVPQTAGSILSWNRSGAYLASDWVNYLLSFRECPAPSHVFFNLSLIPPPLYYDSSFNYCSELDLYIRLGINYPKLVFYLLDDVYVGRGSGKERFSSGQQHLALTDYVAAFSRYKGVLTSSGVIASNKQLVCAVRLKLLKLIELKMIKELKWCFAQKEFRRWFWENRRDFFGIIKMLPRLGLKWVTN